MAKDRVRLNIRALFIFCSDKFILYENGYGNVVGRLKDVIIRGGENIYPKEIEDCIYAHLKVIEVSVRIQLACLKI